MIVFSTLIYALGKAVGPIQAAAMFQQAMGAPPSARGDLLDCLTTLRALQTAAPTTQIAVLVDAGGSHLPKARSRQFTLAAEQNPDVWVSCDDDVSVSAGTMAALLKHAMVDTPRVVVVPCALRGAAASPIVGSRGEALAGDPGSVNVKWAPDTTPREVNGLRRIHHAGFGLVACNRAGLERVARKAAKFEELGRVWSAAFADVMVARPDNPELFDWYGEDLSFFTRAHDAGVECWALVEGHSTHAGLSLNLGGLA